MSLTSTRQGVVLADHTTLRVGGPARRYEVAESTDQLVALVRSADAGAEPVLLIGGGSNLLVGDDGFPGTVIEVATTGLTAEVSACGAATVTVQAGHDWEQLVARTTAEGWSGLEALSGIPGRTGATPIQNVGAYGAEVSQTIASVRTLDRRTGAFRTFAAADCGFGYRHSRFKAEPGRHVICSVTFQLRVGDQSAPVRYAELARRLGVPTGGRAPIADVRAAVLELRASKGMVLADEDPDTWSAGSFFTNPVLPAAELPADAPRFDQPDGTIKTSAAWLIEHAGFLRGYGSGAATLSTKHTLALTNRGGASAADLLALARELRDGVWAAYGVELQPEPVLVGCRL